MPMNPPVPAGYQLMKQTAVTPPMTTWAVAILRDANTYPMFAIATQAFDGVNVLARVEWHEPDFQNQAVHRGVTLYAPIPAPNAADSTPAEGFDVSGYQPTVGWSQALTAGKAFTFIKATESVTLIDHAFADHWAEAKQAGILRGAYHFFRGAQDGAAQAKFFLAQLGDPGELPPVLDLEVTDGVSGASLAAGASAWLDVVTASLGRALIYTSPGFWNAIPELAQVAQRADLWVAHWGALSPAAVNGFPTWKFWQYTNIGTVPGIQPVAKQDLDRFNGSAAALQAYSSAFTAGRGQPAPQTFNIRTTLGVQRALNFLDIPQPPLNEDGILGQLTKAAIETFQRNAGIAVDGIVGQKTIAALQTALAEKM